MKMASQHINIADYYFGFLKNLNHDSKLDLITKLSESLKTNEKRGDVPFLYNHYLEHINLRKQLKRSLPN